MAIPDKTRGGAPDSGESGVLRRLASDRSLRVAWGLFLALGIPLGLIAVLAPLTAAGIYLEPLRPFWRPWPPDILKPVIGVGGFVVTLAYLCYRLGRHAGYRWGTAAAVAMARNIAKGRPAGPAAGGPPDRAPRVPTPPMPRP